MVEGVLTLADRSIKSIMTPRSDIAWLDLEMPMEELMDEVKRMPHGAFPVCEGSLEHVVGCIKAKHMVREELTKEKLRAMAEARPILTVPETITVIRLMRDIFLEYAVYRRGCKEDNIRAEIIQPFSAKFAVAAGFARLQRDPVALLQMCYSLFPP